MLESEFEQLESLVTSFTNKSLIEQGELIRETVNCYLKSKSAETFIQRLVRESENHMYHLAKQMNDSELKDAAFTVAKLRYVAQRFEDISYQEHEIRTDKTRLNLIGLD